LTTFGEQTGQSPLEGIQMRLKPNSIVTYWYSLEWDSVVLLRVQNRLGDEIGRSHIALERRDHLTHHLQADEDEAYLKIQ